MILALIDAEYTLHPFYGSRKMVVHLRTKGYSVNRKRVQRLMRILGLAGMAPGPNTSRPHPQHKIYPYLLRGVNVTRPNQVWSTDITYIRLARGFVYLTAVIDWYSRKVLAWRLSNTLDSEFCVDCLEQSIRSYGTPEIFNTDQGCQFLRMTTGLLAPGGPHEPGRGSSRFYPPVCYQLSQAGTSSLLRIHLPPCTASFDLESPLGSLYPQTTRNDTRLPQSPPAPYELRHPQSLHGSDQVSGFALFCTLTHP